MPATYQVVLKDQSGERVALFDSWRVLKYHRERNWAGIVELQLDLPDERSELFELDGQVEIYRRGGWDDSEWYLDWEGLHRRKDYRLDINGQERFHSWSSGYLELLTRRLGLWWLYNTVDVEDGYLTVTGSPPEVIRDFVNREAGPAAFYASGVDRRIPGLSVAAVVPTAETITARLRNTQLLIRIRAIAEPYGLDILVVGTGPGLFEFRVGDLLGEDHRYGNTAGNPPVVFSTALGNMALPHYVEDHIKEINHIFVAGEGEGATRVIYDQEDAAAIAYSPWNRREGFADGRDLNTAALLQARAAEELAANDAIFDLGFQVLETGASMYGRDFDLGDLVTGTYRGIVRDYIIEAIDVTVTNTGQETIELDLVAL